MKPSKENESKQFIKEYTTVFLCDPSDYDLITSAITWVMDNTNAALPCTTTKDRYNRGDASGAEVKGQEWGKGGGGIIPVMVERLGFNDTVEDWGVHKSSFTKQLWRSFVASCVLPLNRSRAGT
jgi:hypothetical protein